MRGNGGQVTIRKKSSALRAISIPPKAGLLVFICRHLPANEKMDFSAYSVPQVIPSASRENGR
jgi:hypothetical protein